MHLKAYIPIINLVLSAERRHFMYVVVPYRPHVMVNSFIRR